MKIKKSYAAGFCAVTLVVLAPAGLAIKAAARDEGRRPNAVAAGQSIQRAIDHAQPGDTISVAAGVFHENLLITKDHLALRGAPGTVLKPPAKPTANDCNEFGRVTGICVLGKVNTKTNALGRPVVGTTISGFHVRGFSRFGIQLANARKTTIADNELAYNHGWGVIGLFVSGVRYLQNDVHDNNQGGLYIGDSAAARAVVSGNRSYRNGGQGGIGMYFKNAPAGIVNHNRVSDNCVGILFVGVARGAMSDWTARDNIVRHNTAACAPSDEGGPPLSGLGIALLGTDHILLERNQIEANRPTEKTPLAGGVVVAAAPIPHGIAASANTIRHNNIHDNAPADLVYDGRGHGNTFADNGCATSSPATLCGPIVRSRYLTMRDGTRLAIDVWLPRNRVAPIPALVRATRYWRALGVTNPTTPDTNTEEATAITNAGYALVLVDVRGSGASFGTWSSPWSHAEITDLGEVVDWIVRQPWSNGRVGAYGDSYEADTADFLASLGRPAVKAIVAVSDDFDPYTGIAYPGGIFLDWYVKWWNTLNHRLDRNDVCALAPIVRLGCKQLRAALTGVKPVDNDTGGRLLRKALAQHKRNIDVYATGRRLRFRDDRFGGGTIESWSPYTYLSGLAHIRVAVQAWDGWLDAGTADGALARFASTSGPTRVVLGPWSHSLEYDADPFRPASAPLRPSPAEKVAAELAFLDPYLKGAGAPATREIRYYTLGAGTWHTTSVWPPRGTRPEQWFFGPNGSLRRDKPAGDHGSDRYRIDFSASTGSTNRWHTQAAQDVVYPDRAREDAKLLTHTSVPLARNLEITGHPVVTLNLTSTARDGAFFVYLEDIAPNGRVTYITEGELRALDRKISHAKPPYQVFGPYHTFRRADAEPLVPGRLAQLRFALLPTSVLLRKGHRIRIAIAGADQGTFARVPATGTPVVTIARNALHPSGIELPVHA